MISTTDNNVSSHVEESPTPPTNLRRASRHGWAGSVLLHALLLLGLAGSAWFATGMGDRSAGQGADVAMVSDSSDTGDLGGPVGGTSADDSAAPPTPAPSALAPVDAASVVAAGPPTADDGFASVQPGEGSDVATAAVATQGGWANGDFGALAGKGGGAAGGGTGSFFGLRASGGKFVYVVDYSGSMIGPRLDTAKRELARSIRALDPQAKFFIIFYSDNAEAMPADGLVRASADNCDHYLNWARSATCGQGTNPRDAMLRALELKPSAIWLLSDGEFDPEVATTIRQANKRNVVIHTLALVSDAGEAVLRRIAEENKGQYRFVK